MLGFWTLYLVPALATVTGSIRKPNLSLVAWVTLGFFFVLMVGLRHEVGGDWGAYIRQYQDVLGIPLFTALERGDPGYVFLNWLIGKLGLEVYAVNLVCAAVFMSGLISFARQQLNPWLAFTVAVPYLVVVVAMGYTRQSVALGFLFWGIAYLERGHFKHFLAAIIMAALFHKTALLMIGLGVFLHGKGKLIRVIAILIAGYGLWDTLLAEQQESLWRNYVEAAMVSEGAKIRVAMNLLPSIALLIYWKKWLQYFPNAWFWFWMAIATIVTTPFVEVASTAVDRMALYLTPLQVAVFSRLPYLVGHGLTKHMIVGIIVGYALVLFVWLHFATHAQYWLPYQNLLFL